MSTTPSIAQPGIHQKTTPHSRLRQVVALLFATGFALLFAELGVRVLGIDKASRDVGIVPHPLWHHWHKSGHSFDYHVPGEKTVVPVRYNEFGMRQSAEVGMEKALNAFRIAVLGDSFVEALQVTEDEGVTARLLHGMQSTASQDTQVLNFGCSGFSTSLELVLLREFVLKFQPDQVVLLHHFSDVTEDWRFRPHAIWNDDDLNAVRATSSGRSQRINSVLEWSQLYRVTRGLADQRRHRAPPADASLQDTFDAIVHVPYSATDEEAWDYSLHLLKLLADLLAEKKIPLLVVLIPIGPQVEPADQAFARQVGFRYLADGMRLEHVGYQERMMGFCRTHAIACLDLLPTFRHANPSGGPRYYLQRDQHWTAAGHDLAARAIAEALMDNGWPIAPRPFP